MGQLYATRSNESWGMGDLSDLRRLSEWAQRLGAGMVLINPLHASQPVLPQEPSPYSPSSRRYLNPLYLRIEELPGAGRLEELEAAELPRRLAQILSRQGRGRAKLCRDHARAD